MAEAARLLDALADLPKEKELRGMGSEVDIHSIVYSPSLLQFRAGEDPASANSVIIAEPADRAMVRAIGILKSAKEGQRWLVWRTAHPASVSPDTIEALNNAVAEKGIAVFPMAVTGDAVEQFKDLWPKRHVYQVNPMLPDNAIASVLQTIVSRNI